MSLSDLDTTQDFRTASELRELVEAIFNSPPGTQETNWLEWKSQLDLGTLAGRFAIAKAILGFANRSAEQAQLKCAGVAYMVVGVEPGAAAGVTPVDHAVLSHKIKTYADGPRANPYYVPFSGVEVLVVVIEPPRAGDPMHTLQKEFSTDKTTHKASTVFHQGTAHTEPAGPKEIAMLGERLVRGTREPELDLALRVTAEPLTRLRAAKGDIEDWLTRHERYVRAHSGAPSPPPPPPPRESETPIERLAGLSGVSTGISSSLWGSIFADPKGRDEFDRRVKVYTAIVRRCLRPNIVKNIVRSEYKNTVHFTVGNLTDDPVDRVHFMVSVPRSKLAVFTAPPSADQLPPQPEWPDEMRDRFASNMSLSGTPHDFAYLNPHGGSVSDSSDSYEVTWDIGDLRPGQWSRLLELTVVPGPKAPQEVEITMTAGAMNRRCRVTDTARLSISSDEWTPDDFYVAEPDD